MRIAYFDCIGGAAGDMIVASLLNCGASTEVLNDIFSSLGLDGYSIRIEQTRRQALACTRFHVELSRETPQPHRHLKDILRILDESGLAPLIREQSAAIFRRLAQAEATVHGCGIDSVHFHEVGAVDAILDIVGAVAALEDLGVERVGCSPIPTGSGTVRCDHGIMPVPAPATAELLKGVPLAACDEVGEMTTPTGAAVLTTLAAEFGPLSGMSISEIGYGAGTHEWKARPNVLRVFVGAADAGGETDEIVVLETNLDDTSAEVVAYCTERLFDEGALDVYTVPINMKKSRPGVILTVLCEPARADGLERTIFAETTAFGVRRSNARRSKMVRRQEVVRTVYGDIRLKVGRRDGLTTASPEYEDCRVAARERQVPLKTVMEAARAAWADKNNRETT